MEKNMKVISLFSGVGTFDYGFHQAGWQTVHLCEWDKHARQVLRARFPGVPITDDVRDVKGGEITPADCIMFGSPCQDISVAGKRSGMAEGSDSRSSLFFEAVRIIREMREHTGNAFPRFALWENVPGAFSSNGGRDFAEVVRAFLLIGARDVSWRVLDSQHFGVPQRRRRIFLVADFGGERAQEILSESKGVRRHSQASRDKGQGAAVATSHGAGGSGKALDKCLTTGTGKRYDAETETLIPMTVFCRQNTVIGRADTSGPRGSGWQKSVSFTLDTTDPHAVAQPIGVNVFGGNKRADRPLGGFYTEFPAAQSKTLDVSGLNPSAQQGGTMVAYLAKQAVDHPIAFGMYPDATLKIGQNIMPTLRAPTTGGFNSSVAQPMSAPLTYAVRRLTPSECEALQAMPRDWTLVNGMADSHRYRFMGNGGTSLVLTWLAQRMAAVLKEAL